MSDTSSLPTDALPRGFQFAAVKAGIKPSGKTDFAVAFAPRIASAAAMFTTNRVQAAPIVIGRRNLERGEGLLRAVIVNAGNANCATGEAGFRAAEQVCAAAAKTLGCEPHQVLPSSTGIIGVPLPSAKLVAALPEVQRSLAATPEAFANFANAILTTDTRAKIAHTTMDVDGKQVRLAGVCKGAGMIHPQLASATAPLHATMLVYLFTDAALHRRIRRGHLGGRSGVRTHPHRTLHHAREANRRRRRRHYACGRTADRRRSDEPGCRARRACHRQLATREDRVGRIRSQLGT